MTAQDFTHQGYVVSITRRRMGNRLDSKRDFLFFSAYNPTTKHSLKGQGGKIKARQAIDNLKEPDTMNLQPINPPPAINEHYLCTACNSYRAIFADLDGQPFRAYYCQPCANKLNKAPE